MAGNKFVEITQEQVIANPLHFIANSHIALELYEGSYIKAEIVFASRFLIEVIVKDNISSEKGPHLFKAGSNLTFVLKSERGFWKENLKDIRLNVYGISPD
jgi:hypothetical protein